MLLSARPQKETHATAATAANTTNAPQIDGRGENLHANVNEEHIRSVVHRVCTLCMPHVACVSHRSNLSSLASHLSPLAPTLSHLSHLRRQTSPTHSLALSFTHSSIHPFFHPLTQSSTSLASGHHRHFHQPQGGRGRGLKKNCSCCCCFLLLSLIIPSCHYLPPPCTPCTAAIPASWFNFVFFYLPCYYPSSSASASFSSSSPARPSSGPPRVAR